MKKKVKHPPIERFGNVTGFLDDTRYLEYRHRDKSMHIVLKNGLRKRSNGYTLRTARAFVTRGTWQHVKKDGTPVQP